jgi:hypothetical protein
MKQLGHYLNAFAADMHTEVSELSPGIVSRYLTAMTANLLAKTPSFLSERGRPSTADYQYQEDRFH